MESVTIEELVAHSKDFGCTFNVVPTGSKRWTRVFIIDSRGVTLGRISFLGGFLYYIKSYKKDYIRELCNTDRIVLKIQKFAKDEIIISDEEYDSLVKLAHSIVASHMEKMIQWRKANPIKRKRKKLVGRNVRFVLRELIRDYQGITNEEQKG